MSSLNTAAYIAVNGDHIDAIFRKRSHSIQIRSWISPIRRSQRDTAPLARWAKLISGLSRKRASFY
jgi:hypothetical protein